mmetsp:Transcript_22141/g.59730  ORF Transcript_22141/g.59730 Transcript_22141/m.59730 type:complete len:214 (+) Transcript_22141:1072-1713(+)
MEGRGAWRWRPTKAAGRRCSGPKSRPTLETAARGVDAWKAVAAFGKRGEGVGPSRSARLPEVAEMARAAAWHSRCARSALLAAARIGTIRTWEAPEASVPQGGVQSVLGHARPRWRRLHPPRCARVSLGTASVPVARASAGRGGAINATHGHRGGVEARASPRGRRGAPIGSAARGLVVPPRWRAAVHVHGGAGGEARSARAAGTRCGSTRAL